MIRRACWQHRRCRRSRRGRRCWVRRRIWHPRHPRVLSDKPIGRELIAHRYCLRSTRFCDEGEATGRRARLRGRSVRASFAIEEGCGVGSPAGAAKWSGLPGGLNGATRCGNLRSTERPRESKNPRGGCRRAQYVLSHFANYAICRFVSSVAVDQTGGGRATGGPNGQPPEISQLAEENRVPQLGIVIDSATCSGSIR